MMTTAQVSQTSNQPVNQPQDMQIIPTGAALGAEIRGLDLSQPVPEASKVLLRQAWADHLVLLWRGQQLPDLSFLEAAGIFGKTKEPAARKYQVEGGYKVGGKVVPLHPHVSLISNLDEEGHPVMNNGDLGSYEVVWHSDNSYVEQPPAGSMLYARIIPTRGGETFFSNQYQAYDELSGDLKQAIAGRHQVHDASRNSAGILRPTVKLPTTPEEVLGPQHPLVRVHPVTGKKALYLGRRRDWPSNYIVGLSNSDSEQLLDALWAHATQPKYAWGHRDWRVGDLVLWDNRCAMHYRSEVDSTQVRLLYRTVITGEAVIAG
jgi:taurine dioxygenase